MKFYFWIDLLSCIPYHILQIKNAISNLRLLKIIRLFRFKKLVTFLGVKTETQSKIRIGQMIMSFIIIIHWITCIFYVTVLENYNLLKQSTHLEADHLDVDHMDGGKPHFAFNFWIPQFELNDGSTEFYNLEANKQFIQLFYYSILLITGNDIVPQNNNEVIFCSIFLFIGAISIAIITGGISAEMLKSGNMNAQFGAFYDYVDFSLKLHKMDVNIQVKVMNYMLQLNQSNEVHPLMNDFLEFINPDMRYQVIQQVYFERISSFGLFCKSHQHEIMYVAMLMQTKLYINEEEVICQDDEAKYFYIILRGMVTVYIQQTHAEAKLSNVLSYLNKRAVKQMDDQQQNQKKQSFFDKCFNRNKKEELIRKQQNKSQGIQKQRHKGLKFANLKKKKTTKNILNQKLQNNTKKHQILNFDKPQTFNQKNDGNKKGKNDSIINTDRSQISSYYFNDDGNIGYVSTIGQKFDEAHDQIQAQNQQPVRKPYNKFVDKDLYEQAVKRRSQRKPINVLESGDIFGEIALLTGLKRTCSVKTWDNCIFFTLQRENINHIQDKFPTLYNRIFDNMFKYQDEDIVQKCQFVHNVPYFRGLEYNTIKQIAFLIKQQTFEVGDPILSDIMENKNILFVWEGTVQVRVERNDPYTRVEKSFWLDTLERGACISVFNCFEDTKSLVNFYAESPSCIIDYIDVQDLEKLAKDIIVLNDRLNLIKLRIQKGQVDDIDYFTFPVQYLQQQVENQTELDRTLKKNKYCKAKDNMIQQLLGYSRQFKAGKCKFPQAIELLNQIRKDRELQRADIEFIREASRKQMSKMMNIRGVHEQQRKLADKNFYLNLNQQIYAVDDDHDFESMQSIKTDANSHFSHEQGSSYNSSIHDMKELFFGKKNSKKDAKSVKEKNKIDKKYKWSDESEQESVTSTYSSGKEKRQTVKNLIQTDLKQFVKGRIRCYKAKNLYKQMIKNYNFVSDTYLQQIEQVIFDHRNCKLLQHVITKVNDETFQFRNQISIANSNIGAIFSIIERQDLELINNLILDDQEFINRLQGNWSKNNQVDDLANQAKGQVSQQNATTRTANTTTTANELPDPIMDDETSYQKNRNSQEGPIALQRTQTQAERIHFMRQNTQKRKLSSSKLKERRMTTRAQDLLLQDYQSSYQVIVNNDTQQLELDLTQQVSSAVPGNSNENHQNWIYSQKFLNSYGTLEKYLATNRKQQCIVNQINIQLQNQAKIIEKLQRQLEKM